MSDEQAEAAWERYLESLADVEPPPFDENHHRYHTPAWPHEGCANCIYIGWIEVEDHDRDLFMAGWNAAMEAKS